MRGIEGSQFDNGVSFQGGDSGLSFVHFRLCSVQVVLHLGLDSVGFCILLGDDFLFFLDLGLDHVGISRLFLDDLHRLRQIDVFLGEDGCALSEGHLELRDLLVRILELLQTVRQSVLVRIVLFPLLVESVDVEADQVEVGLGRGVDATS